MTPQAVDFTNCLTISSLSYYSVLRGMSQLILLLVYHGFKPCGFIMVRFLQKHLCVLQPVFIQFQTSGYKNPVFSYHRGYHVTGIHLSFVYHTGMK